MMGMEFRAIIAGCRDFNNYELLKEKCDHMLSKKKDTHKVIIVSEHAAGADALGEVYALERGFDLETYAFWDGKSRGTKNMIDLANMKGIPVRIIRY